MIGVRGLVVRGADDSARPRLDGVELAVERGTFVALVGESGSGKSTLLRVLSGFLPFDEGEITIGGLTLRPGPATEGQRLGLRRHAVLVLQEANLFPHLTVTENVTLALRHVRGHDKHTATRAAHAMLERLGLGAHKEAAPESLSGGEAQRVALARALVLEPPVLLLDEPTSALDPKRRADLAALFRERAAGGMTLLSITHDEALAAAADARFTMAAGKLGR